ncbi:MAG: hypothetical protein J6J13_03965 [Clostridia bacterium]|nr:hypothetical protein [Clostridia bacterium]
MEKYIKILYVALCVLIILLLIMFNISKDERTQEKDIESVYILKSYKNTVALYKNNDIAEIYDNVILNTLPLSDQYELNKGISVEDEAQALKFIENYDG